MQTYYCFRCSQPIPDPELELGQVVLTKQGKMFCLRCVTRVKTDYPQLLFVCFFLSVAAFIFQISSTFFGGAMAPSQNKYLETKLSNYQEKEALEESLNRYKSAIRERIDRLASNIEEVSIQTQKDILVLEDKLKKQATPTATTTTSSSEEISHLQLRLDQQVKEFSGLSSQLETVQKQMESSQQQILALGEKISALKINMITYVNPKEVPVIDSEDVKNLADPKEEAFKVVRTTQSETSTDSWKMRLQDRNPNIRLAAILELGKSQEPDLIPLLLGSVKDEYNFARQAAIQALGEKKAESAVPLLIEALEDHHKGVQDATLKSLYQILQKEWGQEYSRLDLKKQLIKKYQDWWAEAGKQK